MQTKLRSLARMSGLMGTTEDEQLTVGSAVLSKVRYLACLDRQIWEALNYCGQNFRTHNKQASNLSCLTCLIQTA